MSKTCLISCNNVADPEPVKVLTICRRVIVREDPSIGVCWPTTDYFVFESETDPGPTRRMAGEAHTFEKPGGFKPGEVVGFLATEHGSTNFQQYEEE